ncbi:MAG TPA: ABC transporter substrate-binding protein [Chloroflexota bacterium]|nr:ABC transporter substrate-binding protein [Chloroflexota bacterium]
MRLRHAAVVAALLLSACGGTAAPASSIGSSAPASAQAAPASASARPAASGGSSAGAKPAASGGAAASAKPAASGAIKFSFPQTTAGFMPLWVAQDTGIFKKYGLDTEMIQLPSPTDLQALLTGETKFAFEGGAGIAAIASGADLTFIAVPANHYAQQLYVTSPDIKTPKDLIGKSIGASSPGASSDGALHGILQHEGISPSQVKIVYLRDDNNIFAALQNGTIQAAVLTKATTPRAKKAGYRLLIDANDLKLPTVNAGAMVRKDWAQQNPDAVAAFLKGVMEGTKATKDDPDTAKATIRKYSKIEDPAQVDQVYQDSLDWVPYPLVQDAGVQTIMDLSTDERVKAHKPSDFYDNSYLEKLQDWVKTLYPQGIPS